MFLWPSRADNIVGLPSGECPLLLQYRLNRRHPFMSATGHYATLSPMAGDFHAAADRPPFFACAESSSVAPSSERRTSTDPAVSAAPSGGVNAKLWQPLPKPASSRSSR